jgi:hypothetical protein
MSSRTSTKWIKINSETVAEGPLLHFLESMMLCFSKKRSGLQLSDNDFDSPVAGFRDFVLGGHQGSCFAAR